MRRAETKILREAWEVDQRLAELGLTRDGLLKVRDIALAASADATPFHPANASGTFGYHYGVFGLRDCFVGEAWQVGRPNGVEVIRNPSIKVMVSFCHVNIACNDEDEPKPRSKKGAGAERAEQQPMLFQNLPRYAPLPERPGSLYYLMVDPNGAAELTRPVVRDETFVAYIERLYLTNGDDLGGQGLSLDDEDIADNFDPQVLRKAG